MMLYRDILLDEDAFKDASDAMAKLKTDTEALRSVNQCSIEIGTCSVFCVLENDLIRRGQIHPSAAHGPFIGRRQQLLAIRNGSVAGDCKRGNRQCQYHSENKADNSLHVFSSIFNMISCVYVVDDSWPPFLWIRPAKYRDIWRKLCLQSMTQRRHLLWCLGLCRKRLPHFSHQFIFCFPQYIVGQ